MRKVLFCLVLLTGCTTAPREPQPNLGILRQECIAWHDSGGYALAFARAAEPARRTAESMTIVPGKTAVVFDIDETLMTNWRYLKQRGFFLEPTTFTKWVEEAHGTPLLPMREVYRIALARGADIFLITGRSESLRAATVRELHHAGYTGWKGLFLKPDTYKDVSIVPFKSGVRKTLESRGYQVVLNVGDQYSDLDGGHAWKRVKLPNPFYFLP